MTAWLNIVGIGEDGVDNLGQEARRLIENAELLVGGNRHLAMDNGNKAKKIAWPKPFQPLIETLGCHAQRRVVVLASGDPSFYGVGSLLVQQFGIDAVKIYPSPSAYSLAAGRLGWHLQDVETLSVHGLPVEKLNMFMQPSAKLLILSHDRESPCRVCELLTRHGFGKSDVAVLEHLGGARERIVKLTAKDVKTDAFADLNTIAVKCISDTNRVETPRLPGLPDEVFEHDGQITKREIRAITLAKLSPNLNECLWDVGAGCGSIGIEWMRCSRGGQAVAIERNKERTEKLLRNARFLGVPDIQLVCGAAPNALADLPTPDTIFIGGGVQTKGVVELCWNTLNPGGKLVINVVSIEGQQVLYDWHQRIGGELIRINIEQATSIGQLKAFKPQMSVMQLFVKKPGKSP